ncbi:MAG: hypothetical protein A3J93_03325 [Candidatus Magasanikbacteria bacterium RIFOXYC2_FULL_42_28]|uniref:Phosphomannomutase n=1 Tax=Candidatus Magasanikbacteria bacterium RIFOXYC2_FULL_42_28 TaxID=1798704 RepID=A0A1F6NUZ7_9BACT|nr:MAG: hypothetical protein A3J93_03325 [Candidatus Magasanikbacteria bacterium RIFOXYC2_FULL_42_28]
MQIKSTIFRDYDIRGVAGDKFDKKIVAEYEKWYGKFPGVTLDLEAATAIGKGYGTIISRNGGTKVVVGNEERPFGKELKDALVAGIISTGISVIDLGVVLTPMVYFLNAYLKTDGGINITGSHNIYFYNGFKMMKKDNWPLYGAELQSLREMIIKEDFVVGKTLGVLEKQTNLIDVYFDYIYSHIKLNKKMKIVVDCGNGCAGLFAVNYLQKLGCEVIGLYIDIDTTYPNHVPDPEPPQNLKDLCKAVLDNHADAGIAFDADGDRVGFIDEKGEIISSDDLLIVMAKDVLGRHPGKTILYDIKGTGLLDKYIKEYGGVPLMHRTGHAPIKETMRKNLDVILGGEVSGHFYSVEDYFKIDDGLWAAARFLELVDKLGCKASELIGGLPRPVRTPEIKMPIEDEIKFEVINKIVAELSKHFTVSMIDGARVQFTVDSWALVRASNTSPYLTLRFEADTEQEVIRMKNILADELEKYPEIGDKLNRKEVASLTGTLGWL